MLRTRRIQKFSSEYNTKRRIDRKTGEIVLHDYEKNNLHGIGIRALEAEKQYGKEAVLRVGSNMVPYHIPTLFQLRNEKIAQYGMDPNQIIPIKAGDYTLVYEPDEGKWYTRPEFDKKLDEWHANKVYHSWSIGRPNNDSDEESSNADEQNRQP